MNQHLVYDAGSGRSVSRLAFPIKYAISVLIRLSLNSRPPRQGASRFWIAVKGWRFGRHLGSCVSGALELGLGQIGWSFRKIMMRLDLVIVPSSGLRHLSQRRSLKSRLHVQCAKSSTFFSGVERGVEPNGRGRPPSMVILLVIHGQDDKIRTRRQINSEFRRNSN